MPLPTHRATQTQNNSQNIHAPSRIRMHSPSIGAGEVSSSLIRVATVISHSPNHWTKQHFPSTFRYTKQPLCLMIEISILCFTCKCYMLCLPLWEIYFIWGGDILLQHGILYSICSEREHFKVFTHFKHLTATFFAVNVFRFHLHLASHKQFKREVDSRLKVPILAIYKYVCFSR
jgi:hypothetical protein